MQLARPRKYANNAEKQKAHRERKGKKVETLSEVERAATEVVAIAEERGFISVGETTLAEKVRALKQFLADAAETQLNLIGGVR